MSAVIIDEDKITVLRDKTAKKADMLKEEYAQLVNLTNQLSGISKNKKGDLPISMLTRKEMTPKLREYIYQECIDAAKRLGVS